VLGFGHTVKPKHLGNIGDKMTTRRFPVTGAAAALLGLSAMAGTATAQDGLEPALTAPSLAAPSLAESALAAPALAEPALAKPALAAPAPPAPGLVEEVPLEPEAAALRDALTARLAGPQKTALSVYAARGFQPIWMAPDGTAGDAALILVDFLGRADEHALPLAKYRADELGRRLTGTPGDAAALEAELTAAFLAYARDLSSGLLEPEKVDRNLHEVPLRPDPVMLLNGAAMSPNLAAYLDGLAPSDPLYRRLVERYRAFRSIAGADIWGPPVSPGSTLRLGDRGPRVAQARARLTAMGDLDPNAYVARAAELDGARVATAEITTDAPVRSFDPGYFDQPMEEALKRFQARHGLNQDGLIGPATAAQLNVSPRQRAEQIAVNLERLRWLNGHLGDRYILVNQAGFEMQVIEHGRPVFASRVIVGESGDHETPEFSELMTHLIVNPSWHVPMSIARNEILPKLKQDPSYLAKQGMRIVGAGADAEMIDWANVTPASFPGRITQAPGDANALGSVKFMFPNRFSVYLHDTPTKRLFERDIRDFSHGCVRVERPHEFAEYLLAGQVSDPGGYFDAVLAQGRERRIDLERPLMVHLTYRSAWIDENGVEQFRGDVYDRDAKIAAALEAAGVRILAASAS
jgi:L,D-transpeptidase YcbB